MSIPTIAEFMDNDWDGVSMPGPAYDSKYGVSCYGPEASGETVEQYEARMKANELRAAGEQKGKR